MPPRGGRAGRGGGGGGGGGGGRRQQQQLQEPLLPTAAANGDAANAAAAAVPPPASTAVTVVDAPPSARHIHSEDDDELHDDERALVPAAASDGSVVYIRQRVRSYAASPLSPAPAAATAQNDTFWPCTFNIGKVLMGAGMMALPRAFALLGWVCGTLMLLAVGGLTFLTLVGLVKAVELVRRQQQQQPGGPPVRSYGALVRRLLGPRAEAALGMAIVGNCFVLNIVFLVIMGDILVGSKQQQQAAGGGGGGGGGGDGGISGSGISGSGNLLLAAGGAAMPPPQQFTSELSRDISSAGLIGELTGITSGLLVDRRVVLAALAALALFPLARSRSMDRLRPLNLVGMLSNGLFAVLMIVLGVRVAFSSGGGGHTTTTRIPAWPQWSLLAGAGASAKSYSPLLAGLGFAAVAPVLLNADVCHQSVMPLVPLLRPYSPRRMCGVLGTALLGCNALYLAIAVGGVAAFGTGVDADVLSEVTATSLARLLAGGGGGGGGGDGGGLTSSPAPPPPSAHIAALAAALALLVRVGYLFSLSGSYVLLTYPLRETIGEALLGGHEQTSRRWTSVTACLVAATYLVACFLPSIWSALSLVGSATCTVMAFAIPGMVVLATQRQAKKRRAQERAEAVAAAAADGAGAAAAALLGAERMDASAERAEPRRRAREALEAAGAWTAVVLGALLFVNGFVVQFFVPASGG